MAFVFKRCTQSKASYFISYYYYVGNGYVRSEGIVMIYIQKKDLAKRAYAEILGIKDSCDGYKEQGKIVTLLTSIL